MSPVKVIKREGYPEYGVASDDGYEEIEYEPDMSLEVARRIVQIINADPDRNLLWDDIEDILTREGFYLGEI